MDVELELYPPEETSFYEGERSLVYREGGTRWGPPKAQPQQSEGN